MYTTNPSPRRNTLDNIPYEPYQHRTRLNSTNYIQTIVNLVKGILGTGILAMPEAFKYSGYVLGTILNFAFYGLLTFCLHLLFQSMYFFCKKNRIPHVTYPDALKEGFKIGPECFRGLANFAPYIVNFFLIIYQVGIMSIYIVFTVENLLQFVNHISAVKFNKETFTMFLIIPFLLLSYIRHLSYLAPFSNVANLFTILGLFCIYYFVFEEIEPLHERNMFGELKNIPLSVGTTVFSLVAIGAILSSEMNMQDARKWRGCNGVLNRGMFIVVVLNTVTGFLGYWKYGENTAPSITLNLDLTNPFAKAVKVLFSCAIYISYAIQAYPAIEILWEQYIYSYMETSEYVIFWEMVLRTILVLLSFLLAHCIPNLGLYISLFGTFCIFVLGIILPSFLDICVHWPNDFGTNKCILIRNTIIIAFGLICWVIGTLGTVIEIVKTYLL